MPRSRIEYHEQPNRAVFTFRLPSGWFAPYAWLWSAAGGLALGILAALILTVCDVIDPSGGSRLTFRMVLIVGAVAGTFALYLGVYITAARGRFLRVTFDYGRSVLIAQRPDAGRRPTRCALTDVIAFRLVEQPAGRKPGCALIMETARRGSVTLVVERRACHDQRSELPHLAGYLAAYLEPVRDVPAPGLPLPALEAYDPD